MHIVKCKQQANVASVGPCQSPHVDSSPSPACSSVLPCVVPGCFKPPWKELKEMFAFQTASYIYSISFIFLGGVTVNCPFSAYTIVDPSVHW